MKKTEEVGATIGPELDDSFEWVVARAEEYDRLRESFFKHLRLALLAWGDVACARVFGYDLRAAIRKHEAGEPVREAPEKDGTARP